MLLLSNEISRIDLICCNEHLVITMRNRTRTLLIAGRLCYPLHYGDSFRRSLPTPFNSKPTIESCSFIMNKSSGVYLNSIQICGTYDASLSTTFT